MSPMNDGLEFAAFIDRVFDRVQLLRRTWDISWLLCEFELKPEDYDIEVPNVVRDNIAEDIEVSVEANLAPFNR